MTDRERQIAEFQRAWQELWRAVAEEWRLYDLLDWLTGKLRGASDD